MAARNNSPRFRLSARPAWSSAHIQTVKWFTRPAPTLGALLFGLGYGTLIAQATAQSGDVSGWSEW
jgi:hypothetical protein